MYTVTLLYTDGNVYKVEHVQKIQYGGSTGVTVEGEAIATHGFPWYAVGYRLFTESGSVIFYSDGQRSVKIFKEKP